jgi:hypothetical protein
LAFAAGRVSDRLGVSVDHWCTTTRDVADTVIGPTI